MAVPHQECGIFLLPEIGKGQAAENEVLLNSMTEQSIQVEVGCKLKYDQGGWAYLVKKSGEVEWVINLLKDVACKSDNKVYIWKPDTQEP